MLLLLLSSFFVPLLPLFPFFLFHLCPESAALMADAGCHEGLGELNSSKYLFPCSRYAHCFPCFSLLSLPSLLSLLCPLSLLSASPASSTSYFAYTLLHFLLSRSSTRFLFFFPPSSASPLLLPGFLSVLSSQSPVPSLCPRLHPTSRCNPFSLSPFPAPLNHDRTPIFWVRATMPGERVWHANDGKVRVQPR